MPRRLTAPKDWQLAGTPPEERRGVMLNARPFLTGAFIALARAEAFGSRPDLQLLEDLLAPIEQPLVDEGVIELVRFGFEATASSGALAVDEEPDQ